MEKMIFRKKKLSFGGKTLNFLEENKYLPVGGIYGTLQLDPGHQHGSNRILMFQAVQRVNILENGDTYYLTFTSAFRFQDLF